MDRNVQLANVYHAMGRKQEADAAFASVKDNPDYIGDAAAIAAFRGDADTAFAYLEKTFESNPTSAKGLVQNAYVMRLQKDPRWLPLLRKMGVDPETLRKIRFTVTLPTDEPEPARAGCFLFLPLTAATAAPVPAPRLPAALTKRDRRGAELLKQRRAHEHALARQRRLRRQRTRRQVEQARQGYVADQHDPRARIGFQRGLQPLSEATQLRRLRHPIARRHTWHQQCHWSGTA